MHLRSDLRPPRGRLRLVTSSYCRFIGASLPSVRKISSTVPSSVAVQRSHSSRKHPKRGSYNRTRQRCRRFSGQGREHIRAVPLDDEARFLNTSVTVSTDSATRTPEYARSYLHLSRSASLRAVVLRATARTDRLSRSLQNLAHKLYAYRHTYR